MKTAPFIKWAGGKSLILNELIQHFPQHISTYYEPFLGGGSVLIELLEKQESKDGICINLFVCSDINKPLIQTYQHIKNNHQMLINMLQELVNTFISLREEECTSKRCVIEIPDEWTIQDAIERNSRRWFYYYIRKEYNKIKDSCSSLEVSIYFIFLNKTCFRGLYREGKNGFNVPYGNYKNPKVFNTPTIERLHYLFVKYDVSFLNKHYNDVHYTTNAFMYMDPPYVPITKTSFTSYVSESFDHKIFAEFVKNIKCRFLMSNSYTPWVVDTFSNNYNLEIIECRRRIHSKKPELKDNEVFIWN